MPTGMGVVFSLGRRWAGHMCWSGLAERGIHLSLGRWTGDVWWSLGRWLLQGNINFSIAALRNIITRFFLFGWFVEVKEQFIGGFVAWCMCGPLARGFSTVGCDLQNTESFIVYVCINLYSFLTNSYIQQWLYPDSNKLQHIKQTLLSLSYKLQLHTGDGVGLGQQIPMFVSYLFSSHHYQSPKATSYTFIDMDV